VAARLLTRPDVHSPIMKQQTTLEGYGYRTSSRFGSWTKISVQDDLVSVTGPRVGASSYRLWIACQLLVLALVVAVALVALVARDWRYLLLVPGLLVLHWLVGVMGAAGLWEMANMTDIGSGHPTHSFPLGTVKRVKIGPGWARKGLWLVILPYVAGINKMAEGYAVSFEAPAGDVVGDAVYAFHMHTTEEAGELARLLQGG
jgi:hypothetical protein